MILDRWVGVHTEYDSTMGLHPLRVPCEERHGNLVEPQHTRETLYRR